MAFSILSSEMLQPGPDMFYNTTFRHIIEMHLPQLRTIYAITEQIDPADYFHYEGDFYGYLLKKGYLAEMFWVMLRLNGMTNPIEFGKSLRDPYADNTPPLLLKPHPDAIAELQQYYLTIQQ